MLSISFDIILQEFIKHKNKKNHQFLQFCKNEIEENLYNQNVPLLYNQLSYLSNHFQYKILIINSQGIIFVKSPNIDDTSEYLNFENKKNIDIAKILKNQTKYGTNISISNLSRLDTLNSSIPIQKDNQLYILRISEKNIFAQVKFIINTAKLIISILVTLMLLSLIIYLNYNLSKPFNQIKSAFQKVADGNLDIKLYQESKVESEELVEGFNNMLHQLNSLFTKIKDQKAEIKAILSSIQEAMVFIDKNDRIKLFNESFCVLVKNKNGKNADDIICDMNNKFYWEAIKDDKINKMISNVRKKKRHFVEEYNIGHFDYLCSLNLLENNKDVVIMFYDITKIKQVEKIKKDFVSNVSHELRTPLTAIKGFLETLLENETKQTQKHYLEIVDRHTNRLINIVQDLLLLSNLDEKSLQIEHKPINFKTIIENVVKILKPKLDLKKLKLIINLEDNISGILGDEFKLEQMFINLVDNAIKYTEKGKIKIEVLKQKNYVLITISDTGIGIPNECLENVFDRFFVVDKSRSKKLMGTGLGLSIVKHIVQAHNGTINVESEIGSGTIFYIKLPLK